MTSMTWGLTLWWTLGWNDGGTLRFKDILYQRFITPFWLKRPIIKMICGAYTNILTGIEPYIQRRTAPTQV